MTREYEAMLKMEGVSKRFAAGNYGVRDFSLELRAGVLGLLGPNGAGKTTLMQMIATVTEPSADRVLFEGRDRVRIRGGRVDMPGNSELQS
jgi:ABC-type multidrug transport system ATPase subunit